MKRFAAMLTMPAHLLAWASSGVASLMVDSPVPLYATLAASGVYGLLLAAPPFRRWVQRNADAQAAPETNEQLEALLAPLSTTQRAHYHRVRSLKAEVLLNYRRLPGGGVLAASSEGRLDALLAAYLRLLSALSSCRQLVASVDRPALENEIRQLQSELDTATGEHVKQIKHKRVEILSKRLERLEQVKESREVMSHQLAAIEDLLKLTHEQSVGLKDPDLVNLQLEALSAEVEASEQTVRQFEELLLFSDESLTRSQPLRAR